MKKAILILITILTALNLMSIGVMADEAPPASKTIFEVNYAAIKPVIDGVIDKAEWKAAQVIEFNAANFAEKELGVVANKGMEEHVSSLVYLLWDVEGLYFATDAFDSTPSFGAEDGFAPNNSDCFQLIFEPMNKKTPGTRSDAYIFTFAPASGPKMDGPTVWYEHWQYIDSDKSLGVIANGKANDQGYALEGFIPWNALRYNSEDFKAEEGTVLGFGLIQVDYKDSQWIDFITTITSFDEASHFSNMKLVKNEVAAGNAVVEDPKTTESQDTNDPATTEPKPVQQETQSVAKEEGNSLFVPIIIAAAVIALVGIFVVIKSKKK